MKHFCVLCAKEESKKQLEVLINRTDNEVCEGALSLSLSLSLSRSLSLSLALSRSLSLSFSLSLSLSVLCATEESKKQLEVLINRTDNEECAREV